MRAAAEGSSFVGGVEELARLQREAAAADARRQPIADRLERPDALVELGAPHAREPLPVALRRLLFLRERVERVYIRMSEEENAARADGDGDGIVVLRRGDEDAPLVLAVGPTPSQVLAATVDLDVTVAYTATPRPLDGAGLRAACGYSRSVVLVEPYLAGTSASEVAAALIDRPTRLLSIGVPLGELRHYGTPAEHRAAHGLDAPGIRKSIDAFLELPAA